MTCSTPSSALPALSLLPLLAFVVAVPALAQHVPFERTFSVPAAAVLDVQTERGRIEVSAGPTDQVIVRGTATVRLGFNVPANALELARQVAANPPVTQDGATIRLRPPTREDEQRAVTISYRVIVPAATDSLVASAALSGSRPAGSLSSNAT